MENKKALYAYFGELGIFNENIPGHTFYQLGLLDELANQYEIDKFDFVNYLDTGMVNLAGRPSFPEDQLGKVFNQFADKLIDNYRLHQSTVFEAIKNKEYSKLFLKARFRNLSTLEKKLKDAAYFETIINIALASGYEAANIVILDTDLSLSNEFLLKLTELGIRREIPSITIPGCSKGFMNACLDVHQAHTNKDSTHLMYYGNLSFDNYKEGHSKNPIIIDIISAIDSTNKFDESSFTMTVAAKHHPTLESWIDTMRNVALCPRENREAIWVDMQMSQVSINVSKDLYLKERFTPARVYESVIFGTIPVSYKDPRFHPAMSFDTVDDFFEICKFLSDCSTGDYFKILRQIADSL
jgi:hypothetical protein